MNLRDPVHIKEESLRWIFSILGALVVFFIAAIIVCNVYHPDIDHLNAIAAQVLAEPWKARPEPMEAMLFRLGIITILPSLCLFYIWLSKRQIPLALTKKGVFVSVSVVLIAGLVLLVVLGFLAEDTSDNTSRFVPVGSDGMSNTNFQFFFNGFFLGNYLWAYALIIVPAICYLFLVGFKKNHWEDKRPLVIAARIAGYIIVGGTLLCILLMNTFSFPYSVENKYDFSAVYYSMTQVYAGSPMLVNGFTNTYGLYPHFLLPIFKLTGLSVFTFSLVMSLVLVLSFVLNFYVLKKFTGNKLILFGGFATLLFFGFLDRKLLNHYDSFFALFPIRYLIPSVLLFLATRCLAAPSGKLYMVTFFVMAALILWNPEIGITCYLSWVVMNVYRDFYDEDSKVNFKAIGRHVVTSLLAVLLVVCLYMLLIKLSYGSWPDMKLLGSTMSLFSTVGFDLLPMDLLHPWNLSALIIIIGFMYAVVKWHRRQITPKASIVLLLSLVSVGYFLYYQGRSHNSSWSTSTCFVILLLTILGDELWGVVKKNGEFLFSALFVVFLFIISFSFVELVYSSPRLVALIYQEEDKKNYADEQADIEAGKLLIESTSQEHERILVMAQKKHQSLFIDVNKRISAFNPGSIELFLQTDVTRLENVIADSSVNIYWEATDVFYPFMSRATATMAALYDYKNSDQHTLVLLKKRTMQIPKNVFFDRKEAPVLHRKYNDDANGLQQRISDAEGIAPVTLGSEFSVEALFYNEPQIYPDATLVGNAQDANGFIIGKVYSSMNYFFSVNGAAGVAPFRDNSWVYIVMNVYPGRADIYGNGIFLFSQPMKSTYRNSAQKLFIGNLQGDKKARFLIGPIAEVNIMNKTLDSSQVRATWAAINHTVNDK